MIGSSDGRHASFATGMTLAAAVAVLALPSAVLAFASRFEGAEDGDADAIAGADRAPDQAQLADSLPVRSLAKGHPFRFTPAGTPTRPDRSVTVAVRVDPQIAREITVRGIRPKPGQEQASTPLQLAPSAFKLGVSRGYQSFAQTAPPVEIRKIEMPDLSAFKQDQPQASTSSRLAPHISLDEKQALGRAPRTFSGDGEAQVDVGGSLRLTRNLDVTAGVRYSQERERLRPLTDGKQDSQAVYVGTEFRF